MGRADRIALIICQNGNRAGSGAQHHFTRRCFHKTGKRHRLAGKDQHKRQ